MNQLVRADDNVSHKTYVYTYDVGGNRTATKIYDFTLETLEGEPTVITQTYGFDLDSNVMRWNDRLKTYNGKQIIYDLEGNPVSYGGKTLNWYGKQLKQMTAADGSYTQYDYDANGLRTQKRQYKADGTTDYTVDYVWSDGKIAVQSLTYPLTMTIQGNTVTRDIKIDSKFIYCDDDTTPSAIMLENDEYLLVRNLQGDVVAVVNAANGETVVEFSYDPWGNVTRKYSETYTDGATEEELKLLDLVMSALCPVTYRGYNYDFTTGLYYLQSRYYNPEWGRFLNTDDTAIMLTKIDDAFSANMYLYCNNNPVNKVDYDGRDAELSYRVRYCINLMVVLIALNNACRNNLNNILPTNVPRPNMFIDNKGEAKIDCIYFDYSISSNSRTTEILIHGIFLTIIAPRHFEAKIEIHSNDDWRYISAGGKMGDYLTNFDNEFYGISYGLSEVLPGDYLFKFNVAEVGRNILTEKVTNSKRGQYINHELKEQEKLGIDSACILNWYCSYERRKFAGKYINVDYVEHIPANEGPNAWW